MSRASWYRHGKPDKKPKRARVADIAAQVGASSVRSYQRMMRVLQDPEIAPFVMGEGGLTFGEAERLITDPERKRRFLALIKAEQKKRP